MTPNQAELVARLANIDIVGTFNGSFLNCSKVIKRTNGKLQTMKASFVFDDAEGCFGGRYVPRSAKGTYGEAVRDWAFEIIVKFAEETAGQEAQ